jgi:hypothetical protein
MTIARRTQVAVSDADAAIQLDDGYTKAYLRRAIARRRLGQTKEARPAGGRAARQTRTGQSPTANRATANRAAERDGLPSRPSDAALRTAAGLAWPGARDTGLSPRNRAPRARSDPRPLA